jgi:hypothetical protein
VLLSYERATKLGLDDLAWDYEAITQKRVIERVNKREAMQKRVEALVKLEFTSKLRPLKPLFGLVTLCYWISRTHTMCFLAECHEPAQQHRVLCKRHAKTREIHIVREPAVLDIIEDYACGLYMTTQVAERYRVSTKMVQRLAREAGCITNCRRESGASPC